MVEGEIREGKEDKFVLCCQVSGDKFVLCCQVSGDKFVLCCQVSGDGRRTVSSLLVTPGEEDAGRTLTCLARNTRDNTSLEAQVTLQVICKYTTFDHV